MAWALGFTRATKVGVIITVVRLGHGFVRPYDAAQAFMSGGIMSTRGAWLDTGIAHNGSESLFPALWGPVGSLR